MRAGNALAACGYAGVIVIAAGQLKAADDMAALVERYSTDAGSLLRAYRTDSPTGRDRMRQFYGEWAARLKQVNFEALDQEGKVDYVLLRQTLDGELRQLSRRVKTELDTAPLVPFAQAVYDLEAARQRVDAMDARKAAATLAALAKQVAKLQAVVAESLRAGAADKRSARNAALTVTTLRTILERWYTFYNGYDPLFTWWAPEPYKAADEALLAYATFLSEKVAGVPLAAAPRQSAGGRDGRSSGAGGSATGNSAAPANVRSDTTDDIVGDPIGRDGLLAALDDEMIPYTPEELVAIARKELDRCEGEMKKASREMGFGDDWHKALEKVKEMHVEPGQQPKLIRDLAQEAIDFVDMHDLITVPQLARETWRMEMMTPERQLVNPFFTGGEVISVSFPLASMTYDQKEMGMRGNNIPFSRATVLHELIPGHHLQLFMAERERPYRRLFGNTPFFVEGWALYWELLLWDMKFQKTPEDRVGALFWHMHRCARIIFSLSFHLGTMTPKQCVDLLVERVGHERDNAIGEVRRSFNGSYPPLYQAGYLLGGMQLYALHKELVDSGKMTNRQFHDAVLAGNGMPIEMVRARLTGQKLTRDYQTSWRFYGAAGDSPAQPGAVR